MTVSTYCVLSCFEGVREDDGGDRGLFFFSVCELCCLKVDSLHCHLNDRACDAAGVLFNIQLVLKSFLFVSPFVIACPHHVYSWQ
jgi:hypothetical protein